MAGLEVALGRSAGAECCRQGMSKTLGLPVECAVLGQHGVIPHQSPNRHASRLKESEQDGRLGAGFNTVSLTQPNRLVWKLI